MLRFQGIGNVLGIKAVKRWMIGHIGVDRVNEIEGPLFPPAAMLPDFDPAVLEAHWDALVPRFYEPHSGRMVGPVRG
jgi:hypothetical protein